MAETGPNHGGTSAADDAGSLISADLRARLAAAAASGGPSVELRAEIDALAPDLVAAALPAETDDPYSRLVVHAAGDVEIMLARWRSSAGCSPHDHGGSSGFVTALSGSFGERRYRWEGSTLGVAEELDHPAGDAFAFGADVIHDMASGPDGGVTFHVYAPPPTHMHVYDLEAAEVLDLHGDFGAWIPAGEHPRVPFAEATTDRAVEAEDRSGSYDKVAELYDRAYVDIKVREAEWAWVSGHADALVRELGRPLRVVEVGCGNGAMLRELDQRGVIGDALGLDESTAQIDRARERTGDAHPNLRFGRIDGSTIDLPDGSVDVVLSFLSFRYLDWPAIAAEARRVLAPGGRVWVVDMVRQPLALTELPIFLRSALHHLRVPKRHPQFARDVATLTSHPDWKAMLAQNPARSGVEHQQFLEGAFAPGKVEVLTVTRTQRVVAFDSGPVARAAVPSA